MTLAKHPQCAPLSDVLLCGNPCIHDYCSFRAIKELLKSNGFLKLEKTALMYIEMLMLVEAKFFHLFI